MYPHLPSTAPPPKRPGVRVPCEVSGSASFPLSPHWPRRRLSPSPGHLPLPYPPRRSRLAPPRGCWPRVVPGLTCKKYSAEITPLARSVSRAAPFTRFVQPLRLHSDSVQEYRVLASISRAINPALRARFQRARANRRDFPGGRAGQRAARLLRGASGSARWRRSLQ